MIKRIWTFSKNIHGDEINDCGGRRSVWYWGSGKYGFQYYYCRHLNKCGFKEFHGTRKELDEFLRK